MSDPHPDARTRLLDALSREGIDCPPDRLDDTVQDFSHLLTFLDEIRDALANPQEPRDEG